MRVAHFAIALLLFSGIFTLVATAAEPSKPLLSNGNFEADKNGDAWPDGWSRPKAGGTWATEGGNRFLRLKPDMPDEMIMVYVPVPVPSNAKALELKWRQRVTDLKPGKQPWFDARIILDLKDSSGKKLKAGPSPPYTRKSTDGWVERSAKFLVPPGSVTLEIMPALFQVQTGTFDLDDFSLTPVDPAPLEEAAKAAAAKKSAAADARREKAALAYEKHGSLISNGNFEADANSDQWPDGWGRLKTGSSWETDGDNHFLRLTSVKPGDTVMMYRTIDIPAKVAALELTWRQRTSNLRPGKELWYDARIMLELVDADGQKLKPTPGAPNTRTNNDSWVAKSKKFLVPEGALALEFMPSLFQVQQGTLDLDDFVLKPTDPAILLAEAEAAARAERTANIPAEAPQRDKWPAEIHVEGKQVLDTNGKPVWLQGVNVVSLEFLVRGDHVLKSIQVACDDWKSNCIRLPVKEEYWFGRWSGQKDGGAAYRELVDAAITMAANRGSYVLLDLHRFRAPKDEHVEFWKDAAAKYKDHPAVIFDLFNEPHGMSWEVWRNGGFVAEKKKPADEDAFLTPEEKAKNKEGFESPGMQRLVDVVRETGAKNVVLVGGLDWAYDLSGIANGFGLDDRGGHGIIYATHIYPWKSNWQDKVLVVAEKHPVLLGEVGCDIHKMDFIPASAQEDPYTWAPDMLGLIQKHKLHWTAFSFHPKATPVMITGWDYEPTPFWGAFVKRALAGEQFELKRLR